jgi:hypothetical protein
MRRQAGTLLSSAAVLLFALAAAALLAPGATAQQPTPPPTTPSPTTPTPTPPPIQPSPTPTPPTPTPPTPTPPTPTATPTVIQPMILLGSVTLNGRPAPDGTDILALVVGTVCGRTQATGGRYTVAVLSASTVAGCGVTGAPVTFTVGGVPADQATIFQPGAVVELNLTAGQAATPTPTPPTPTPSPSPTPPASPTPTPTPTATPSPTPAATPTPPPPTPTPPPTLVSVTAGVQCPDAAYDGRGDPLPRPGQTFGVRVTCRLTATEATDFSATVVFNLGDEVRAVSATASHGTTAITGTQVQWGGFVLDANETATITIVLDVTPGAGSVGRPVTLFTSTSTTGRTLSGGIVNVAGPALDTTQVRGLLGGGIVTTAAPAPPPAPAAAPPVPARPPAAPAAAPALPRVGTGVRGAPMAWLPAAALAGLLAVIPLFAVRRRR